MRHAGYAKLAAWVSLALLIAAGQSNLPLKVRFQLADGVQVSGELTSWDRDGIDGSFGRRLWADIEVDDVWRLHQQIIDPRSVAHWTDLGRIMLLRTDQAKKARDFAERAFGRALNLSPEASDAIEQARREAAATAKQRRDAEQAALAARLATTSPEGQPWPSDPWPTLSAEDQKSATLAMRAEAERILKQAGLSFALLESAHFMLYTDVPRQEAARWITLLERLHDATGMLLSRFADHSGPAAAPPPTLTWGKMAVFVFLEQDRFRLVEAEAFNQLVPQGTVGICHPRGPKVFVCLHRCADDDELFQWTLLHEAAHGLLHHFHTPRRPPAWANDGLAEGVTAMVLRDSTVGKQRRAQALNFIRSHGNPTSVLDWTYADQTWPGPDGIGLPIGHLMVELLLREQPRRFMRWIEAVKGGEEWEKALKSEMGISRATLIETFAQYYKVND